MGMVPISARALDLPVPLIFRPSPRKETGGGFILNPNSDAPHTSVRSGFDQRDTANPKLSLTT
ncbi:MAG: hypothetical protein ACMUJM_24520 [bacterium]